MPELRTRADVTARVDSVELMPGGMSILYETPKDLIAKSVA